MITFECNVVLRWCGVHINFLSYVCLYRYLQICSVVHFVPFSIALHTFRRIGFSIHIILIIVTSPCSANVNYVCKYNLHWRNRIKFRYNSMSNAQYMQTLLPKAKSHDEVEVRRKESVWDPLKSYSSMHACILYACCISDDEMARLNSFAVIILILIGANFFTSTRRYVILKYNDDDIFICVEISPYNLYKMKMCSFRKCKSLLLLLPWL